MLAVDLKDGRVELTLKENKVITTDHVVVTIGAVPNTDLAEKSELEVHPDLGGFVVNTELQARSHLFAVSNYNFTLFSFFLLHVHIYVFYI